MKLFYKFFALTLVLIALFSHCSLTDHIPPAGDRIFDGTIMNYHHYNIVRVSRDPLFAANGSVNSHVLDSLMIILNDPVLNPILRQPKSQWPTGMVFNYRPSYTEITAEDFFSYLRQHITDCINSLLPVRCAFDYFFSGK